MTRLKHATVGFGLALMLLAQAAFGFPTYPNRIPNGSSFSCITCHGPSGPPLNNFGSDFLAGGATWTAALAAKDSDKDGSTNGTELGDPNGTWKSGMANPPGPVSNPGDPASKPATVTAPSITTQPTSQTVTEGANVSFLVVVTGTAPLTYQWQKNGANLPGATAASLLLNNVTGTDAGVYRVLVSNSAGSTTSANATLSVSSTPTLGIALTSPANGALFTSPANVLLSATVTGATIAQVDFFDGTNHLGTITSAPYELVASNLLAGEHVFAAMVSDTTGASVVSEYAAVQVIDRSPDANLPPAVQLVTPGEAATFRAPARIVLGALARDPDGEVAQVEFFSGTESLGVGVPVRDRQRDDDDDFDHHEGGVLYVLVLNRVQSGVYNVIAKATDNLGATMTSEPVKITVRRSSGRGR